MNHTIKHLPVLVLNAHNRCNCRCVMCEIWKRETPENFSAATLQAQIPAIAAMEVESITLSGGEPLMNPGLFDLCTLLRARKIRITLLSSGLLLARFAQQIVEQIDEVIVSLDGPPDLHDRIRNIHGAFDKLAAGIRRLRELQPGFPVGARCTVQRANYGALVATIAAAREVGVDSLSFLAADTHSGAFDRTSPFPQRNFVEIQAADLETLDREIDSIAHSGQCGGFVVESEAKLRRIAVHFRVNLALQEPVSPVCNAPWYSTVIESDGTVRPCFFHEPIGKIDAEHNLEAVLNSEQAIQFRRTLDIAANPVCRRCVCSLNWKPAAAASETNPAAAVR